MKTIMNLRSGDLGTQPELMPDKVAIQNMGGYKRNDLIQVTTGGKTKIYKFTGYDIKALS